MKFDGLYEFTPAGMEAFQQAFTGMLEEEAIDLGSRAVAVRIPGTGSFEARTFETTLEMALAIVEAAGSSDVPGLLGREGLWAWLAFVLRDAVYPRRRDGRRKLGEVHRWYPSDLANYQKGQRHLVRMPVLLLSSFGKTVEYLLSGSPSVPGELREQLTSQQNMFHGAFQGAARALYYDEERKTFRKGAAGKRGGSSRRLAKVRQQLDVTWNLFALSSEQFIEKLPAEFDKFKPALVTGQPTAIASNQAQPAMSPEAK